eukprot:4079-Heterococcus_DN1.PRE.12
MQQHQQTRDERSLDDTAAASFCSGTQSSIDSVVLYKLAERMPVNWNNKCLYTVYFECTMKKKYSYIPGCLPVHIVIVLALTA